MTTTVLPHQRNFKEATSEDPVAVRVDNVTKTYGSGDSAVVALRGVDLDVKAGELMMLVGPSGCGKTTLILVIAGILDQDSGECRVFGQDYHRMTGREKTRYRGETIGFVFQASNLPPPLPAAEDAAVERHNNGVPGRAAVERAREMLDKVDLGDRG